MKKIVKLGNAQQGSNATLSQLVGTPNQIEWAEQIRPRVGAEFDRVSNALLAVAAKQSEQDRLGTRAIIAILEDKRNSQSSQISRSTAGKKESVVDIR